MVLGFEDSGFSLGIACCSAVVLRIPSELVSSDLSMMRAIAATNSIDEPPRRGADLRREAVCGGFKLFLVLPATAARLKAKAHSSEECAMPWRKLAVKEIWSRSLWERGGASLLYEEKQ